MREGRGPRSEGHISILVLAPSAFRGAVLAFQPRTGRHSNAIVQSHDRAGDARRTVEDAPLPTGQCLESMGNQPTAKCWRCPYKNQTREHVFKNCPRREIRQKTLWANVWEETGRWKDRLKIRDLLGAVRRYWTSSPPRMWGGGPSPG